MSEIRMSEIRMSEIRMSSTGDKIFRALQVIILKAQDTCTISILCQSGPQIYYF